MAESTEMRDETTTRSAVLRLAETPELVELAEQLKWSKTQLYNECAAAILTLIEEPVPTIPELVTFARTVRAHRATMMDRRRPFPETNALTIHDPLNAEERDELPRLVAKRQETDRKKK